MGTTAYPHHSPEIAYLQTGRNGLMTGYEVDAFADGVVRLFQQAQELDALREGCRASAGEYTVERMADNFCEGILACLAMREKEKKRSWWGRRAVAGGAE